MCEVNKNAPSRQAPLVNIRFIFHKHIKIVIRVYHFKGIKIPNNMRMYFKQVCVIIKNAVRELT